jgi:VIT1/CCC1 family predicted Fe2+/Mn2+ transporter
MPSDWAERERQRLDHRKQHQRETLDAWAERAEQRDSSYRDYLARLYSPETQRVRSVFLRLVLASAAVFFLGVLVFVVSGLVGRNPGEPLTTLTVVGVSMMALGGAALFTTLLVSLVVGMAQYARAWWRWASGR